jgi:CxxC motif-containing protein (DUF1111 family)
MVSEDLARSRRRASLVVLVLGGLAIFWFFSPGLPVLIGPWATAGAKAEGKALFEHEWQPNDPLAKGDGLGPVFNARSCVACHSQGGVGGGGGTEHNVTAFEVHPTKEDPDLHEGVVHTSAVQEAFQETPDHVTRLFPPVRGKTEFHCGRPVKGPDFDRIQYQSINTPALFGAGWIDRISDKAITNNQMRRLAANAKQELELTFDTPPVGRYRNVRGGVGKFGWKAQFASLRDFVAHACANELGLGNPVEAQSAPLGAPGAAEDKPDLDRGQFRSLVAFVDTLPRPAEVLPDNPAQREQAEHGKELFGSVGCAICHTPDIGGVKGVYSDFLLYKIDRGRGLGDGGDGYGQAKPPELPDPPIDHPALEEWKTPPLWGVADSAPYFHDGAAPTLDAAILRHGGDAASITRQYRKLAIPDQQALIAFLRTLRAPRDAAPVPAPTTAVAQR